MLPSFPCKCRSSVNITSKILVCEHTVIIIVFFFFFFFIIIIIIIIISISILIIITIILTKCDGFITAIAK